MAAGAARHGARKPVRGTDNTLQALGVAGGGLVAVTLLTVLVGGPADPAAAGRAARDGVVGVTDRLEGSRAAVAPTSGPGATVPVRSTTARAHPPSPVPTAPSDTSVARHDRPRRPPRRRPRPEQAAVTPSPAPGTALRRRTVRRRPRPGADPDDRARRPTGPPRPPRPTPPPAHATADTRGAAVTAPAGPQPDADALTAPARRGESVRAPGRCTAYWP